MLSEKTRTCLSAMSAPNPRANLTPFHWVFTPHSEYRAQVIPAVLVLLCEAFTPTPIREGSKYILSFKPKFEALVSRGELVADAEAQRRR